MNEITTANIIPVSLHLLTNSINDSAEIAMIGRWRKEYEKISAGRNRRQKILDAISEGYDTLSEIASETGIPYPTTRRIVQLLAKQKRIIRNESKNSNNSILFRFEII